MHFQGPQISEFADKKTANYEGRLFLKVYYEAEKVCGSIRRVLWHACCFQKHNFTKSKTRRKFKFSLVRNQFIFGQINPEIHKKTKRTNFSGTGSFLRAIRWQVHTSKYVFHGNSDFTKEDFNQFSVSFWTPKIWHSKWSLKKVVIVYLIVSIRNGWVILPTTKKKVALLFEN